MTANYEVRQVVLAVAIIVGSCLSLEAQTTPANKWNFNVGGGVSPLVGDITSRLNTGWHLTVGGGYNIDSRAAIVLEYTRSGFGVDDSVLNALSVPDGSARLHSLSLGPMWRFRTEERVGGYGILGVGFYKRTVEFTEPTFALVNIIDPWFGYQGSVLVPANQVIGSISSNAAGVNFGGGLTVGGPLVDGAARLYVEVRYHYAPTRGANTQMLPITVGIRW